MPRRLVMTRQVRDWLHALRSGDSVTRRLVAAGDKSGQWQEWYAQAIPAAEAAYEAYLKEQR